MKSNTLQKIGTRSERQILLQNWFPKEGTSVPIERGNFRLSHDIGFVPVPPK